MKVLMSFLMLVSVTCFSQTIGNVTINVGPLKDSVEVIGMEKYKYDVNICLKDSLLREITYTGKIGIIQKCEFQKCCNNKIRDFMVFWSNTEKRLFFSEKKLSTAKLNEVGEIEYKIQDMRGSIFPAGMPSFECLLKKECFIKFFNEKFIQRELNFYRVGHLFFRASTGIEYYMGMRFRKEDIHQINIFNNDNLILQIQYEELIGSPIYKE